MASRSELPAVPGSEFVQLLLVGGEDFGKGLRIILVTIELAVGRVVLQHQEVVDGVEEIDQGQEREVRVGAAGNGAQEADGVIELERKLAVFPRANGQALEFLLQGIEKDGGLFQQFSQGDVPQAITDWCLLRAHG